jgi:hypothetical protein
MTDCELSIGRGPDFAMTSGHMVYFHRAEMSISRENGKSERLNMSHASLAMLLKSVHEALRAMSGTHQVKIEWIIRQNLEGVVMNHGGSIRVKFRFPNIMSQSQRSILTEKIQDFFKEFK